MMSVTHSSLERNHKQTVMRIAIDGRSIVRKTSGIGQYTEHLVRSLVEIDRESEYLLFLIEPNDAIEAPNLTKVMIVGYERMILNRWWENVLLPRFIELHDIDLYFAPAYALPFLPRHRKLVSLLPLPHNLKKYFNEGRKRVTYVVTIHDMISYLHPQYFTPKMQMWQHLFVTNAVKVADHIISDSHTTKQDIMKFFPVEDKKISVIAPWFDQKFAPVTDVSLLEKTRQRYSLPKKYILYLGTIEPRKNVAGIVQAYGLLPQRLREEYALVLGGSLGWYTEEILAQIEKTRSQGKIHMLDYVEHRHLTALYTMARAFVFPAFYEGFGLPPLEAMACGTPVITSNVSAIPEVVGDAALMVNPSDTQELSDAIVRLLEDSSLHASLRKRGLERARSFNWRTNAEATLRVFRDTVERISGRSD
ncbi:MAG: glycosyltransferase family 4 protein [Ignavibacteriae bacterium]|nr:glycosyltransferase family 4 protein [Ignavibacteriota bacterium]